MEDPTKEVFVTARGGGKTTAAVEFTVNTVRRSPRGKREPYRDAVWERADALVATHDSRARADLYEQIVTALEAEGLVVGTQRQANIIEAHDGRGPGWRILVLCEADLERSRGLDHWTTVVVDNADRFEEGIEDYRLSRFMADLFAAANEGPTLADLERRWHAAKLESDEAELAAAERDEETGLVAMMASDGPIGPGVDPRDLGAALRKTGKDRS